METSIIATEIEHNVVMRAGDGEKELEHSNESNQTGAREQSKERGGSEVRCPILPKRSFPGRERRHPTQIRRDGPSGPAGLRPLFFFLGRGQDMGAKDGQVKHSTHDRSIRERPVSMKSLVL